MKCPYCSETDPGFPIGANRHHLWPTGAAHFGYELQAASVPPRWRYWAFSPGACMVYGGDYCEWFDTGVIVDDNAAVVSDADEAVLAAWPGIYFIRALVAADGSVIGWTTVEHRFSVAPPGYGRQLGNTGSTIDAGAGGSDQGVTDQWWH